MRSTMPVRQRKSVMTRSARRKPLPPGALRVWTPRRRRDGGPAHLTARSCSRASRSRTGSGRYGPGQCSCEQSVPPGAWARPMVRPGAAASPLTGLTELAVLTVLAESGGRLEPLEPVGPPSPRAQAERGRRARSRQTASASRPARRALAAPCERIAREPVALASRSHAVSRAAVRARRSGRGVPARNGTRRLTTRAAEPRRACRSRPGLPRHGVLAKQPATLASRSACRAETAQPSGRGRSAARGARRFVRQLPLRRRLPRATRYDPKRRSGA